MPSNLPSESLIQLALGFQPQNSKYFTTTLNQNVGTGLIGTLNPPTRLYILSLNHVKD